MAIELDVSPATSIPPRRRDQRRRRWVVAGIVATVAGAAAVAVAIGSPPPPEPQVVVDLDGRLGWVEQLVDAPPRGALAEDDAFTRGLTDRVTDLVRAGTLHRDLAAVDDGMHSSQDVKLIYADDIDDRRIVLLALRLPVAEWTTAQSYPDPLAMLGRTKIVWLSGPRGSSPTWLAAAFTPSPPRDVLVGSILANPLLVATVGEMQWRGPGSVGCTDGVPCTMIALTPPGCTIATAREPDLTDFRDAPTGSYLVRTAATYRLERWRVTCDGVVRDDRMSPPMVQVLPPSEADIDAALAGTAGLGADERTRADVRAQAMGLVYNLQQWTGLPLTGPARILWAGPAPDDAASGPPALAMVAAAPSVGSIWLANYSVEDGSVGGSFWSEVFQLDADPTALGQMLAIPLPVDDASGRVVASRIVAMPPHTATAVRFVDPETGAGSESRVVEGAAFVLTASLAPLSRLTSAEVVAVDAAGNPVAANVPAAPFVSDFIANWE